MRFVNVSPSLLIEQGYRRTSNAHGLVSRIDRADWKEHMAQWHGRDGARWVAVMSETPGSAEDFYRRCISKDTLTVRQNVARKIPNSSNDPVGYVPRKRFAIQPGAANTVAK